MLRRFLTPRWLLRHAAMVALVGAFLWLGWWQVDRARAGNLLSFGYAIEWPVFALFVIFVWTREIRLELHGGSPPPARRPRREVPEELRIELPPPSTRSPAGDDARTTASPAGDAAPTTASPAGDDETSAYNEYLAWLAEHPDVRPGGYRPGR